MKRVLYSCVAFSALTAAYAPASAEALSAEQVEAMLEDWSAGGSISYDSLTVEGETARLENFSEAYVFGFDVPGGQRVEFRVLSEVPWVSLTPDADVAGRFQLGMAETANIKLVMPKEMAAETGMEAIGYVIRQEGFAGWYQNGDGANSFEMSADVLEMTTEGMDNMPGGGSMKAVSLATGVVYAGQYAAGMDLSDPDTVDLQMTFKADSQTQTQTISERGQTVTFNISAGPTEGAAALTGDAVSLTGVIDGMDMVVEGGPMPFPISISAEGYGVAMSMPMRASEDSRTVSVDLDVRGLVIDDNIWGMVDPMGMLDHSIDRLRVAFDMDAMWRINIFGFDPMEIQNMVFNGVQPVEPTAVSLNDIRVEALGAAFVASGALDLSGDVLSGDVAVSLAEWQPLLQTFVEMGLVPPQQASMGQAMVGGMAVDGANGESLFAISFKDGVTSINDNPVAPAPPLR